MNKRKLGWENDLIDNSLNKSDFYTQLLNFILILEIEKFITPELREK